MNKKAIGIVALLIIIAAVGTAAILWRAGMLDAIFAPRHLSDEKFNEIVSSDEFSELPAVEDKVINMKGVDIKVRTEEEVWSEMHQMANTKIVADEIWGLIDSTTERINMLIIEVEKSNFSTRNDLLDILYRWKQGDYRQAVEDHNYVWELLGGTVGKAKALNTETMEAMSMKFEKE